MFAVMTVILLQIVIVLIVFPLGLVDGGPFWSTVFSLWFGMAFYLLTFVSVSLVVIVRRRRETTS